MVCYYHQVVGVLVFVLHAEDLREEACQQHVYTKVLDAVDKHQTDKFLSEVAIEQLSILVLSGSNSVVLSIAALYHHY